METTIMEKHFSPEQRLASHTAEQQYLVSTPMSGVASSAPKPSAHRVAISRAAHQLIDAPVLFEDPLAIRIIGDVDAAALRHNPDKHKNQTDIGMRASLVVRSRLAEDTWETAQQAGVRQYVLLGAGLDTFAYRRPENHAGRVFEVDLPATQQWKRTCLLEAGIAEPDFVSYVPLDFERTTLADALAQAGFQHDKPALFAWLGVTVYLDAAAVLQTLRFIASCAPGSGVVFDYCIDPALLSPMEQMGIDVLAAQFAAYGEPWKSLYDPAVLEETMRSLGFAAIENLDADELNERYLTGRDDGLRLSGICSLMRASV
jgi:methyltransferase (TIGR00027 family)